MKPTEVLEREHHFIMHVAACMVHLAEDLGKGQEISTATLADILEFLRTFADQCHHGKEEDYLFRMLEKKGIPAKGCPLGVLRMEHDQARSLVGQLANISGQYAKDGSEKETLRTTLLRLVELYKGHIWKEDYLLFPMTNKVLSTKEQETLNEQFEQMDSRMGTDVSDEFEKLAAKLQHEVMHE
jgi:hemerythrin-like domain-containing protein